MEGLFQVMPPLSAEEYAELKADIQVRGVMVPIEYDEAGAVLDGHHRLKACTELGLKEWPSVVRLGMDAQAKTLHAIKLNCARRHLTTAGKQTAIQKALQAAPEKSDRQLAKAIGVSHPTVATARKDMEEKGELVKFTTSTGLDGKEYPRQVERKAPEPELILNVGGSHIYEPQRPISITVAKPEHAATSGDGPATFRRCWQSRILTGAGQSWHSWPLFSRYGLAIDRFLLNNILVVVIE